MGLLIIMALFSGFVQWVGSGLQGIQRVGSAGGFIVLVQWVGSVGGFIGSVQLEVSREAK